MEPVLGTFTQHMAMGKVYTLGRKQADKCMKLAATAYNLKKWLKFTQKRVKKGAGILPVYTAALKAAISAILNHFRPTSRQLGFWMGY